MRFALLFLVACDVAPSGDAGPTIPFDAHREHTLSEGCANALDRAVCMNGEIMVPRACWEERCADLCVMKGCSFRVRPPRCKWRRADVVLCVREL